MEILLTSFGITSNTSDQGASLDSLFYRMPPVSKRTLNNVLMPDFAALLLCDRVIMDEVSFALLQERLYPLYADVAETFSVLHREGLVRLVNFESILREYLPLLQRMVDHDLEHPEQWLAPLSESMDIWLRYLQEFRSLPDFDPYASPRINMSRAMHFTPQRDVHSAHSLIHFLSNSEWPQVYQLKKLLDKPKRKRITADELKSLKALLRTYLAYVNANIVLSNELGAGFHDWGDYLPFYDRKFLTVGRTDSLIDQQAKATEELFEISFPEFRIETARELVRVLRDKRVEDLRRLVTEAVEGRVTFDVDFAKRTLMEVFSIEQQASRQREIISYLSLPLSLLPWVGTPAQLLADKGGGALASQKLKENYRWFYLLSDVKKEREDQERKARQSKQ